VNRGRVSSKAMRDVDSLGLPLTCIINKAVRSPCGRNAGALWQHGLPGRIEQDPYGSHLWNFKVPERFKDEVVS
jgi:hypothetical protein